MSNKRMTLVKAFTLVELIVVIAIMSILIAVVVPSFTRFIDNGRFSNDVQKAASMTTVMQAYSVTENESFDSYDVRTIIETYHGGPFDFTPTASNTGFFYIESENKVLALKYDDAEATFSELASESTELLAHTQIDDGVTFRTPAELFGDGNHLLTREGSAVAFAVDFVYRLAQTGNALETGYALGLETLESYSSDGIIGTIASILGFGLSEALEIKVKDMLDYYDPDRTLYVNDVAWNTTATSGSQIDKIVFAPGMTNVPRFDLQLDEIELPIVTLPKTVNSVDDGAFKEGTFIVGEVIVSNTGDIKAGEDAFSGVSSISKVTTTFDRDDISYLITGPNGDPLISYDPEIIVDTFSLDLSGLKGYLDAQGIIVASFNVNLFLSDLDVVEGGSYLSKVYVYTKAGYLGYVIPEPDVS